MCQRPAAHQVFGLAATWTWQQAWKASEAFLTTLDSGSSTLLAVLAEKKPRFGTVTRAHGDMAWALVSGATFRRFDSSPAPRRADVLETGDIGGD